MKVYKKVVNSLFSSRVFLTAFAVFSVLLGVTMFSIFLFQEPLQVARLFLDGTESQGAVNVFLAFYLASSMLITVLSLTSAVLIFIALKTGDYKNPVYAE